MLVDHVQKCPEYLTVNFYIERSIKRGFLEILSRQ